MKNVFFALLLTTTLASPAFAQIQTTTTIKHSDGTVTTETGVVNPELQTGKVIDTKTQAVQNADGSVTTIRKVTTESDAPAYRPAGIPAHAKARNVTTTTTSTTTPAGVAPAAGVTGIVTTPTIVAPAIAVPGVSTTTSSQTTTTGIIR